MKIFSKDTKAESPAFEKLRKKAVVEIFEALKLLQSAESYIDELEFTGKNKIQAWVLAAIENLGYSKKELSKIKASASTEAGRNNPDTNDIHTASLRVIKELDKGSTLDNAVKQYGSRESEKLLNKAMESIADLANQLSIDWEENN